MHPSKLVAYVCLGLSMALVGTYVALSKPMVAAFPVFLLAWLRFGIASVAMWPWLKKPPDEAPLSGQTKRLLFLQSFLGNFLFSVCMLFGVSMTSAVSAGVIMASIPAVVALQGSIFLRERVDNRTWCAIGLAAAGMVMLSMQKASGAGHVPEPGAAPLHNPLWGNLLVFIAVVCEASYVVIGKRLSASLGPKRVSALINLWGLMLVTPLGLWAARGFAFDGVTWDVWALLVFYALAASMWSVWLWMTGLKAVPAVQAGVFTVMLPVAAVAVGVAWLDESLSGMQMAAFALALGGLLLATVPHRKSDEKTRNFPL
ncbi:MAG: hypothetical protein RLZZ126_1756 [Pseudomonadota bacterium]|jgi:drug/metabolite transporter (DMT)-like permease